MEENEGKEKKQKKKMQPKRWLAGFLGIFLAGLAGCMALVIWVDPFFQYHKPLAWFPYLVDNQVNQNPGLAKQMCIRDREYPFDSEYILKKSKSLKRRLLEENTQRIPKKIAVLGGCLLYTSRCV